MHNEPRIVSYGSFPCFLFAFFTTLVKMLDSSNLGYLKKWGVVDGPLSMLVLILALVPE